MLKPIEVEVKEDMEKALKILKRKMSLEGVFRELKSRKFYEKPSRKKRRKQKEAERRRRKRQRRMNNSDSMNRNYRRSFGRK